jgi:hypothetical protein
MSRRLSAWLALLAASAGGCAGGPRDQAGRLVAEHPAGAAPARASAPYRADYALYREDDGGPGRQAVLWRGLAEKEVVGFEQGADGELAALAGPDRIPLAGGRYCWRVTPESELHGADLARHETGKALAEAGRFTCSAALGVVLLPFVVLWGIPVSPFFW